MGAIVVAVGLLTVSIARARDYLRSDREFNSGSRIETRAVSAVQIENLVLLGKVWGLAKYHHPQITSGQVQWDYELFRVMPAILAAASSEEASRELASWVRSFGKPQPCGNCRAVLLDLHLAPGTDWIRDTSALGAELSEILILIQGTRPESQHFVAHRRYVGNPEFLNERRYLQQTSPDAGFRLLALFRFWNVIEYWFPYRDVIGEDWDAVLKEFVPRLMLAEGQGAYRREMIQLFARVNDGHTFSRTPGVPPGGHAQIPVRVRFVEGKAVVTGHAHDVLGPETGLRTGDILLRVGGVPVDSLLSDWEPYYAASTDAARLREFARALTRGPPGKVGLEIQRQGVVFELSVARVPWLRDAGSFRHDLPGPPFQMLTDEVAYLKLSSAERRNIDLYLRRAEGASVLVVDIRNYPRENVVYPLGERLVSEPTEFVRFTRAHPGSPGSFKWTDPLVLRPRTPHFSGAVVILVDETTQSHAEYTAMALRASPNAVVVGSTTAGANGDVSGIPLPGGLEPRISGIGVFYPDRTPTQRVGIVPDVVVRPTIAGIREGRDEVLEVGVSHALGREFRFQIP